MKHLISLLILALIGIAGISQNVKEDKNGNYIQVRKQPDTTSAKKTGKWYEDLKGERYPVFISKNGKLFVIRTSKTGTKYRYYIKP